MFLHNVVPHLIPKEWTNSCRDIFNNWILEPSYISCKVPPSRSHTEDSAFSYHVGLLQFSRFMEASRDPIDSWYIRTTDEKKKYKYFVFDRFIFGCSAGTMFLRGPLKRTYFEFLDGLPCILCIRVILKAVQVIFLHGSIKIWPMWDVHTHPTFWLVHRVGLYHFDLVSVVFCYWYGSFN